MALDDAGIEAVISRKGKIVINKKDLKKAESSFEEIIQKRWSSRVTNRRY